MGARKIKRENRIEHQADDEVSRCKRWPDAFPTKPKSPAASQKNNPSRKDVEVVGIFGGGIEDECGSEAPNDEEGNANARQHIIGCSLFTKKSIRCKHGKNFAKRMEIFFCS